MNLIIYFHFFFDKNIAFKIQFDIIKINIVKEEGGYNAMVDLLNKKELAEKLKVSIVTINRLLAKGLPNIKVGTSVRFDYDEVINWLKERDK